MKKRTLLRIITILSTIVLILGLSTLSFAKVNPSDITPKGTSQFDTIGTKILGGIQAVGTIISVGVLVVLGIKYMMGSAEEKASYKKTMIPYIIGAVLVFAAVNIAQMVYKFSTQVKDAV